MLHRIDIYQSDSRQAIILQEDSTGALVVDFHQDDVYHGRISYSGYNIHYVRDACENYINKIFDAEKYINEHQ